MLGRPPIEHLVTVVLPTPQAGSLIVQEIEMENGKLAYSFDIKVPSRSGIEEVLVDAKTGAMIAHEHETPKQQAMEPAQDARRAHEGQERKGRAG